MSAGLAPTAPAPVTVAGPVTQVRVVHAEWTKLRALRSTWWCGLSAVVLIVGLGAAIAGSGTPYRVSAGNSAASGRRPPPLSRMPRESRAPAPQPRSAGLPAADLQRWNIVAVLAAWQPGSINAPSWLSWQHQCSIVAESYHRAVRQEPVGVAEGDERKAHVGDLMTPFH